MKKIFTLICTAAVALGAMAGEFVSPGNGTTYTFADLAKIDSCGVRSVDGVWVLDSTFTISEGDVLRIQNNDVIMFTNKLQLTINGKLESTPADTALITAVEGSTPKGFRLYNDNASAVLKNTRVEVIGFNFGSANGTFVAENCTFADYNASIASGANINFSKANTGNVIKGCTFENGATAAIGNGANTPIGIKISNCTFKGNNTKNSNRPQINLTSYGTEDVEIVDNVVIGGHFTKVGGIAVSNMLGYEFSNKVTVKGNLVKENRYGITMTGPVNMVIEDNEIVDNIYETNANNGGSAISLYDSSGKGKVVVKGNYMANNLWGITVIGAPDVNAGKVEDPTAADYNPGENTFLNNGNNDVIYEFYNNGTGTVYAQGNYWKDCAKQDSASIETVVFHKVDNDALGLVIFMPAGEEEPTSIDDVNTNAQVAGVSYFDLMGRRSEAPFEGMNIVVTRYTDGKVSSRKVMK